MKKLMITLAAVAMAAGVQAATYTWETGGLSFDGSTTMASGTAKGSLWLVSDISSFAGITDGKELSLAILAASGDLGTPTFGPQNSEKKGALTFDAMNTRSYTTGQDYYAVILYTTTQDGTDYYMGNYAHVKPASDTAYSVNNLAKIIGGTGDIAGTAGANATAWAAQDVPEPTSGLLLLLGVAGLALKRKRA